MPRTTSPGANWRLAVAPRFAHAASSTFGAPSERSMSRTRRTRSGTDFAARLDAQLVVAGELDVAVLLHQLDDADRIDRRVRREGDRRHLLAGIDSCDAVGLGEDAQAVNVEERLRLRRQLAEAVGDLLEQGVDLLGLARAGESLVQRQADVDVAAVGVGQQRGRVQVDLGHRRERRQQVGLAAVLQRTHRLGEHVVVELEADLHHVAALVVAEHLAGAADLEVVHREVEARAELFHLLDRLEPLRRLPWTAPRRRGP